MKDRSDESRVSTARGSSVVGAVGSGLAALALLFPLAAGAAAQEAGFDPDVLEFGEVETGETGVVQFTITSVIDDDLRIFAVEFLEGDNPSGAYSRALLDPIGEPMMMGSFVRVEVTFAPELVGRHPAVLTVVSNDNSNPIATLDVSGAGVDELPSPFQLVSSLVDGFDRAVRAGALVGTGATRTTAHARLLLVRARLEEVRLLVALGQGDWACRSLVFLQLRSDGDPSPPDLVQGAAREELYRRLVELGTALGC